MTYRSLRSRRTMVRMIGTTETSDTLRVAILPDSFKGSATAGEIAAAMGRGVKNAFSHRPETVLVDTLPFADGGEGTLDAVCSAWSIEPRTVRVTDALGRPAQARYAVSDDGRTGVVEAAEANGLPQVSDVPAEPLRASTYGVGGVISAVLDAGCEEVLLCIGGSATTDGGAGLIQALGARLVDGQGDDVAPGGAALTSLQRVDLGGLDPRAAEVRWRIACDVTNPLLGERGAAAVFGPQKGATAEDIEVLERGLTRFAEVLASHQGRDDRDLPGMGAAGGMPLALKSLFGAELVPGGDLVADALGAVPILSTADLVLTGEGRLDSQSLQGKVVDTVRRMTPAGTPVIVVAGAVELGPEHLRSAGITAAFSIASGAQRLEELQATALERLEVTCEQIVAVYLSSRRW